ncbi:MAG: PKD domain-containing protein [Bdellovibrio sp.]
MINNKRIVLMMGLILSIGCQKSPIDENLDAAVDSSAIDCSSQLASAEGQELKINGKSAAQSGSSLRYVLSNSSGECIDGNSVSWKAAGSSRSKTSSAGLTSVFKLAGSYVITAQEKSSLSAEPAATFKTAVVSDQLAISGPQAAFTFNPVVFNLILPKDFSASQISWDFGDGSAVVQDNLSPEHMYFQAGVYHLSVSVTDSSGQVSSLSHRITIFTLIDGMSCLPELSISGATEARLNVATYMSVHIPSCLSDKIGAISWSFGDGQSASDQSVSHAYAAVGSYNITATLSLKGSSEPWIILDHSIKVIEDLVIPEEPEEPADPNLCSVQGASRDSHGEIYSERASCGIQGTKIVSYLDSIVEECQLVGEKLNWVEVSRSKEITNEGECEGQSCQLPDGSLLSHGAVKVLYSSSSPSGSCSSVSEERRCSNGQLSGSSSANQLVCHNGCGNFGVHGSVKTAVETGEIQVPLVCAYGEQGFFDIFTEVSDQVCQDGQVVSSNARQGSLKTAGSCPVYSYAPSEQFSACSADCGGSQDRIFVCQDDKGSIVDSVRCQNLVAPVESRVCDGNPMAAAYQTSAVRQEEANSSELCPANQIGVVVKIRDVTDIKNYACIDHQVQLESEVSTPGAWAEERYCRDYIARRCSQDSLSNDEAQGRYQWMVKCQDELPIIKEFLDKFGSVSVSLSGKKTTLNTSGRDIYPTFMDHSTTPEKPWIAPKNKNADCVMPATAYVSTICVSSCATPEQVILAEEVSGKMKYVSFIDALTQNTGHVASLKNAQSLHSKVVNKVKVDQWVTELIDSEHEILVFKMKSGRELRVTPNHPLLRADGVMKTAAEFTLSDSLVQLGGELDPIESISPIKHFGKVYNVFVQSDDTYKNILITNGYLNGSAYFQNSGAQDMNRSLFRQKMLRGVFK